MPRHTLWTTQSQQERVKHSSSSLTSMSVSSVIVSRLLFPTAGMNSYHEVEDESQSVIVISVVGEKAFLYFSRLIFIFKNIFLFDNLLFFYLVAVLNIITWMVMITGIAVGMFSVLSFLCLFVMHATIKMLFYSGHLPRG